jgi:3-oxoacid CoA-transferase A subunit
VVLVAGFAGAGWPEGLLRALRATGVGNLTCVCQGTWSGPSDIPSGTSAPAPGLDDAFKGVADLVASGQVRKLVCPMPFYPGRGGPVEARWRSGDLEIEAVPQGVLAEALRAGGAGLGGVFLPTGAPMKSGFQERREVRRFGMKDYVFQPALRGDFALLRAGAADTLGNLVYRGTQRNWNPVMAMAARVTVVEVDEVLEPGGLDPEVIITPGIFVKRIVQKV